MYEATNTPNARSSRPYIPSLDGLRAVSVLLVFVAHAGLGRIIPGGFGVTIFFFLSGFLITTLFRTEFDNNNNISVRHFFLRRAFRIMPPFYFVLLATVIASAPGTLRTSAVIAQALNFSNYWAIWYGNDGIPPGTGIFWSLAVEEHFYLVFPVVYIGLRKLNMAPHRQALLLWGLCAIVLLWRCILVLHYHSPPDRTYLATDTRIDSILFGCALAVWKNPVLDTPHLNAKLWQFYVLPAASLILLFCLVYRSETFRETLRYSLQGISLTFIFVAAIEFKDWPVFNFLNAPPIAFLGVLSYSIYLVHHTILDAFKATFQTHQLTGSALALIASIGIAWLMYLIIEKPCARWRRRLTSHAKY